MSNVHLVYAFGIAGGVLALGRNILITMTLKLNVQAFMAQMEKLIKADNVDRALKLAQAVPRAYLTSGVRPALEVFLKGGAKRADLVAAYEQGVATKKPMLMIGKVVTAIAGMLAVGGLVVAFMNAETVPAEVYAAPAIALFFAFGGEFLSSRIVEEANAGFGKLLDLLKDARR